MTVESKLEVAFDAYLNDNYNVYLARVPTR